MNFKLALQITLYKVKSANYSGKNEKTGNWLWSQTEENKNKSHKHARFNNWVKKKKQRKKEAYSNGLLDPEMKLKFEGHLINNEYGSGFAWWKQEIRDWWMEMECLLGLCNGLLSYFVETERLRINRGSFIFAIESSNLCCNVTCFCKKGHLNCTKHSSR